MFPMRLSAKINFTHTICSNVWHLDMLNCEITYVRIFSKKKKDGSTLFYVLVVPRYHQPIFIYLTQRNLFTKIAKNKRTMYAIILWFNPSSGVRDHSLDSMMTSRWSPQILFCISRICYEDSVHEIHLSKWYIYICIYIYKYIYIYIHIYISCEWKAFNWFVPSEESGVLFWFERSKVTDYMNSANKLLATEMLMRFLYQLLPVILFIDHHQPFGERNNGRVEQVDGPYQLLSTPSIPYHWLLYKYMR